MATKPSNTTLRRRFEAAGYRLSEGAYHGTSDDRIGRWYVDRADADLLDRRGPGWPTKRAAMEETLRVLQSRAA